MDPSNAIDRIECLQSALQEKKLEVEVLTEALDYARSIVCQDGMRLRTVSPLPYRPCEESKRGRRMAIGGVIKA